MRRLALLMAAILLGACSAQVSAEPGYVLREGAIDGPNQMVAAAPATIQVENTGEYSHTLLVTDQRGEVLAATGLIDSGARTSLEVDLEAGIYVFSCRIVSQADDGSLVDHFEQGMHRTVTVG